ncbi:hypothetical protein IP88_05525 [alpha proteobacterium AAP81b]|nr:hypothetical protein IP88_05525 [alpha proteobacterium AAP81b]
MLAISVRPVATLTAVERTAIVDLCSRAYEEDFAPYFAVMPDFVHVCGHIDGVLVAHAGWVTRWLQAGDGALLRTAYVEAVATLPEAQGRGHASAILAALPPHWVTFDIAALSPSDVGFYARFGWEAWRGPLLARRDGVAAMPDETAMILRLPRTPDLDIAASLSIEWREGEVW